MTLRCAGCGKFISREDHITGRAKSIYRYAAAAWETLCKRCFAQSMEPPECTEESALVEG